MYSSEEEFAYYQVALSEVDTLAKGSTIRLNIKVYPQQRSLKAILLLFLEPFISGARHSENYIFPDLTKVSVTINRSPNMLYSKGIESKDIWGEAHSFFVKDKNKTEPKNMTKFYTDHKFALVIGLHSMAGPSAQAMHGNDTPMMNTKDGVHLETE